MMSYSQEKDLMLTDLMNQGYILNGQNGQDIMNNDQGNLQQMIPLITMQKLMNNNSENSIDIADNKKQKATPFLVSAPISSRLILRWALLTRSAGVLSSWMFTWSGKERRFPISRENISNDPTVRICCWCEKEVEEYLEPGKPARKWRSEGQGCKIS